MIAVSTAKQAMHQASSCCQRGGLLLLLVLFAAMFAQRATAELSINGSCVQGHRWSATLINQGGGGIATYNACAPGADLVVVQCTPGNATVTFRTEAPIPGAAQGQVLTAQMIVGGTAYPVQGVARYSEMLNGSFADLSLRRDDPLFAALGAGRSAQLRVGAFVQDMHPSGSSNALSAMFKGCG